MKYDHAPLLPFMRADACEAGCDEAGRGCLAGPVFAAAVVFPPDITLPGLDDSKKLSEKKRYELRPLIEERAVAFGVGVVSADEIDHINILRASIKAMHLALDKLNLALQHIIVDGNKFTPYHDVPYDCVVKGDGKYLSIAAASVLAKTYRDDYMNKIAREFPQYLWSKNKGYPTAEHRRAIEKYGATIHHRKSFTLTDKQLSIIFE